MMYRRLPMLIGLTLSVLVAGGCTKLFTNTPPLAPVVIFAPVSESQGVLDYLHTIQNWPADRLEVHLEALEKAYAAQPDEALRLRLAIALGFGRCASCKSARAIKLFKAVRNTAEDGASVALAMLCIDTLEARANIAATKQQLAREQQQIRELQQKLDALTSIEESLHQRE